MPIRAEFAHMGQAISTSDTAFSAAPVHTQYTRRGEGHVVWMSLV